MSNQSLPFNVTEWLHSSSDIHPISLRQLGWFSLEWYFCSQHTGTWVHKCPQPGMNHMNPPQNLVLMVVFVGPFWSIVWWVASVVWLTEKQYLCPVFIDVAHHRPGFWVRIGSVRWVLVLACCFLLYCPVSSNLHGVVNTHHANLDEPVRGSYPYTPKWDI